MPRVRGVEPTGCCVGTLGPCEQQSVRVLSLSRDWADGQMHQQYVRSTCTHAPVQMHTMCHYYRDVYRSMSMSYIVRSVFHLNVCDPQSEVSASEAQCKEAAHQGQLIQLSRCSSSRSAIQSLLIKSLNNPSSSAADARPSGVDENHIIPHR